MTRNTQIQISIPLIHFDYMLCWKLHLNKLRTIDSTLLGGGTLRLKVKIPVYASEVLKFQSQISDYNSDSIFVKIADL